MSDLDWVSLIVGALTVVAYCLAAVSGYLYRRRMAKEASYGYYYGYVLFDPDDPFLSALEFVLLGALISTIGYVLVGWQMGWAWAHFWGWQNICFFGIIPVSIACVYGLVADPDNFDWLVGLVIVAVCAVGYLIGQFLWPIVVVACGYFLIRDGLNALWRFLQDQFYSWLVSGDALEGD